MASKAEEPRISVPYIPFSTFTGFIDKLKNSAVPSVIDGSVLQNMSGSTRVQLMSALKSMQLTESGGAVKPALKELVKAYNTSDWAPQLRDIWLAAFEHVTSDVDLDSGTAQQLAKAFKDKGNVDGQVLDKAVRFYLAGLKEAELTYSPHFDARKARKVGARKAPKKKGKTATEPDELDFEDDNEILLVNSPRLKFRLPIRGRGDAIISLPSDVTAEDWAILDAQISAFIRPPKAKGGGHE